jgi:hypothetical protein
MRAMGGAAKPPARCCSKSHRICQIRPSTKPIAIATEISKTIKSHQVIGMFLPANLTRLPEQRLPDSFYVATLEIERAGEVASGAICERRWEIVIQLTISLQSQNVP